MRFLPLLSSELDPAPWAGFAAVELVWSADGHPGWGEALRQGRQVHAVHLPSLPWGSDLLEAAGAAGREGLGWDFLVIPAAAPLGREARSAFLGTLEVLLEVFQGRGPKVALRPAPGVAPALAALLREVRGEAVGFCWDADLDADLEAVSDRILTAVGSPLDDFSALRRLGYRWNMALPSTDPAETAETIARLRAVWPEVLFPEVHP